MDIRTNIPLKNLTTMKLGGPTRFFAEIHTPSELQELYQNAVSKQIPVFVIGGGSNLVAQDAGYQGLVLRMRIPGFEVLTDDIYSTVIKIGAGEVWDPIVAKTVQMNLSGIEALSAIPGTAGAAPVQNIGAYGQEISETLVSLEAYDTSNNTFVTLQNSDCHFSYRYSIFRGDEQGRYIITNITLELSKNQPSPPFYDSLQAYLDEHAIQTITHQSVRDAVVDIRKEKLPDPAVKPSSGSFFKNTIVEQWKITDIQKTYPELKSYDMGDGNFKISTGWLIEKCGFKGQLIHGMRINEKNCLVLINESATGYSDLAEARDEIITKVRDTFQIQLEQEPLEIPAS
ncbi:MAG: UDP-N-acetylpyruvoylglucosamine reductase [Candidatus Saccharibacteria bacterium]|nr:UDP-N-acetylpyruvoylglucosamine reductase [Candidatus Saccharibacteria bacterium]